MQINISPERILRFTRITMYAGIGFAFWYTLFAIWVELAAIRSYIEALWYMASSLPH